MPRITRRSTGLLLLSWLGVSVLGLLLLEAWTLADSVAANHISAVVRVWFYAQPGVFVWLAFSLGYLAGHFFWSDKG